MRRTTTTSIVAAAGTLLVSTFRGSSCSCCCYVSLSLGERMGSLRQFGVSVNRNQNRNLRISRLSSTSSSDISNTSIESKDMKFEFTHLESVQSTQDEAKRRLLEGSYSDIPLKFAISAEEQTLGRGTNGRTWIGNSGNMFLTIAFPYDCLPVPVTLLPLKVGSIVASRIKEILKGETENKVTLKWPNDTLIDDKKVAGVLIETGSKNNDTYFLIGIGVNVLIAPEVPSSGTERGRTATSISEYVNVDVVPLDAKDLALNISNDIFDWIDNESSIFSKELLGQQVIGEWKSFVNNWGKTLMLRDDSKGVLPIVPLGIESDGQLRIRDKFGREKLLCAEYLL